MQFCDLASGQGPTVVCFSRLLKCLRSLYGKQCGPRSDCSYSGSTLLASILNLSVMLDNYLQRTTSAEDIFRCISFLGTMNSETLDEIILLGSALSAKINLQRKKYNDTNAY